MSSNKDLEQHQQNVNSYTVFIANKVTTHFQEVLQPIKGQPPFEILYSDIKIKVINFKNVQSSPIVTMAWSMSNSLMRTMHSFIQVSCSCTHNQFHQQLPPLTEPKANTMNVFE